MAEITHDTRAWQDRDARAQRVQLVDGAGAAIPGGGGTGLTDAELRATPVQVTLPAAVVRTTTINRYAVGPVGASAHGTQNIAAGKRGYSVAVITAAGATPTLDGVALPAGWVGNFTADGANTLEAAVLITAAGDDVILTTVA